MSTAAHEPRRVGPRRTESPSGSKVTPRRNAFQSSEPPGLQYDSDELPVLIRLPDLRDIGSVETRPAATAQTKNQRIDRASASNRNASRASASKVGKKSLQQRAGNNKLVLGGIVGGILVVVMLFFFNAGSTPPPSDQDGWASEAAAIESPVEGLEIALPTPVEPPPQFPVFAYEAPQPETEQYDLEQAPIEVPHLRDYQAPQQSGTTALSSNHRAAVAWPSDEAMGLQSSAGSTPANGWPNEGLSQEQGRYEYPPTDSPGQTDFRSSMNESAAESYRMGKLESDRPPVTQGGSSSILNGNIEIPDTTSIR